MKDMSKKTGKSNISEEHVNSNEPIKSDDILGSHTDHYQRPLQRRMGLNPMHGEELEAYSWAMNKLHEQYPEDNESSLIDRAIDDGIFYVNEDDGALYVTQI